jgi:hypothetical protein
MGMWRDAGAETDSSKRKFTTHTWLEASPGSPPRALAAALFSIKGAGSGRTNRVERLTR